MKEIKHIIDKKIKENRINSLIYLYNSFHIAQSQWCNKNDIDKIAKYDRTLAKLYRRYMEKYSELL